MNGILCNVTIPNAISKIIKQQIICCYSDSSRSQEQKNAKGPLYLSEYTDESFVCCFGFNKSLMRVFEPPDYRYMYVRRSIKTKKNMLYADKHEFCITIVMVRQLIFSDLVLIFDAVFKNSPAIIYQYICIVHMLFLFLYTV